MKTSLHLFKFYKKGEIMKMLKKILLPTDFSIFSRRALEMAITLAKNFDSEITLLHVIPGFPKSKEVRDMLNKTAQDQFAAIREKISLSGGKTTEPVIASGSYSDQIIQLAEKQDVNLILLGSGEKEVSGKCKLSTTVTKVIWKSNKPVWVVKRDEPNYIKRIICPIDFTQPSRRALNNAIHLARVFNAELAVLTVIAQITSSSLRLDVQLTSEQQLIAGKQISKLEHFLKEFDFHNVRVIKEVYQGKPYQEILKRINARKSDLLVMGTTDRTDLSRILKSNVTEKVIRELPCSFITLKEEDVIRLHLDTKIRDLETHFKESKQLMSRRFVKEALHQLQHCLHIDRLYIPAWEGMAYAHEQLGHKEKAQHCHNKVKEIQEQIKHQEVEHDLHRHIPFFKR